MSMKYEEAITMTIPIPVDVWSDFVCPWCFLASTSIDKLKASHGVEVTWHSFELRPAGSPPMPDSYRQRIEQTRPQMEQMARERYGIEINSGPFGISSRDALIGAKFADAQGMGEAYHDATFRAYWQDARDISDRTVLREIAESVGLDGEAFAAALDEPAYDEEVQMDVDQAGLLGLTGVPALIFAKKYLVSGAQPYEVLVNVVEQVRDKIETN